jgi:hypothetical protein
MRKTGSAGLAAQFRLATAPLPAAMRHCKGYPRRRVSRPATLRGPVAQWLEPAAHNGLVPGSSPGRPTTLRPDGLRVAQPCKAVRAKRVRRSLSAAKAKTTGPAIPTDCGAAVSPRVLPQDPPVSWPQNDFGGCGRPGVDAGKCARALEQRPFFEPSQCSELAGRERCYGLPEIDRGIAV